MSRPDGVFWGVQPDSKGSPTATHLADDEEEFIFHIDHDTLIASAIQDADSDPKSLTEACSQPDWPLWKAAMDKEIATLEGAGTCSRIARPGGKNIVGSKWVFRIKHKSDGTVEARLVARGITQVYGVDCLGTYSPIAKIASFRAILAIAARYDRDIESSDFNGAYLKGTLNDDEEIYMQEPSGYETQG